MYTREAIKKLGNEVIETQERKRDLEMSLVLENAESLRKLFEDMEYEQMLEIKAIQVTVIT